MKANKKRRIKMKKMITAIILTGAVLFTAAAQGPNMREMMREKAMRARHHHHGHMHGFNRKMMEQLEVTAEQRDKIEAVRVRFQKQMIDLQAEMKKLRIDKRTEMNALNFSKAKNINKLMSDNMLKMKNAKIDEISEMVKILNKEQTEKYKELNSSAGRAEGMKMRKTHKKH